MIFAYKNSHCTEMIHLHQLLDAANPVSSTFSFPLILRSLMAIISSNSPPQRPGKSLSSPSAKSELFLATVAKGLLRGHHIPISSDNADCQWQCQKQRYSKLNNTGLPTSISKPETLG